MFGPGRGVPHVSLQRNFVPSTAPAMLVESLFGGEHGEGRQALDPWHLRPAALQGSLYPFHRGGSAGALVLYDRCDSLCFIGGKGVGLGRDGPRDLCSPLACQCCCSGCPGASRWLLGSRSLHLAHFTALQEIRGLNRRAAYGGSPLPLPDTQSA